MVHVTDYFSCFLHSEGLACEKKSCGTSRAWFGLVGPGHTLYTQCGGIGECNVASGECE